MMISEQLPLEFEFKANQTFHDFFADGHNQEIVSHLQKSIAGEGEQQVFIWGSAGLGKSHLLQACCHYAHSVKRSSFYFALNKAHLPEPNVLQGLEKYEVVCFDNVENIAGRNAWELAFFNFFNAHRDAGHTLIMSAQCLPKDLALTLPDLKTRFNWGLTLKLYPLIDDNKIAALMFKADLMGFEISPQVGRFLLSHHDDLDSLWALLAKLDRASLAAKRKLTIPFLKEILSDISDNR
jgi:DnaA family protein